MILSVAEIIAFLGRHATPKAGDEIEIDIDGLGVLTNTLAADGVHR